MPEALFDVATFLDTRHKGGLDTAYVLPPEGDYTATSTDKMNVRSGVVQDGDYAGNIWAALELQWELQDEALKTKLNMEHVYVRQSIMLDMDQEKWRTAKRAEMDWGVNRNMRVRRLLDATGLNSQKEWNPNMFKHQSAMVKVEHRRIEGMDDPIAEVTRVVSLKRARNGS